MFRKFPQRNTCFFVSVTDYQVISALSHRGELTCAGGFGVDALSVQSFYISPLGDSQGASDQKDAEELSMVSHKKQARGLPPDTAGPSPALGTRRC